MEQQALLDQFNGLLDSYRKHREYIRRVSEQSEKFSGAVIERVKLDHEVKSSAVADEILPLVAEILSATASIKEDLHSINHGKSDSDVELEELNLRLAIGEIDDDEFASLSEGLRGVLDDAASRISGHQEALDSLQGGIDQWVELASEAGQETGVSESAPEEAPAEEEEAPVEPEEEAPAEEEEAPATVPEEDSVDLPFDVTGEADAVEAEVEIDDSDADSGESSDGLDESEDEVSFDAGESEGDVDLDLVGGANGDSEGADEIAIDLEAAVSGGSDAEASEDASSDEESRRALLLYQEGTPEEQIYPFTSDVLTVGRGRDNDIQIKNDSKVSRFHCKLYRRNGNYYIEDNKSSNGTLVNSELITERRLFGGEEVIIGETFFRFRLM